MSRTYMTVKEREQAKAMLGVTPYVFVYGTLKSSYGNNRVLEAAEFIGEDSTTDGWLLGQAGIPYAFSPAIVPDEYKKLLRPIRGEIWKVDDYLTCLRLDALEGYDPDPQHAHYWRRVVQTKTYKLACWIYTQENFKHAYRMNAAGLTDKGEWIWSRNSIQVA